MVVIEKKPRVLLRAGGENWHTVEICSVALQLRTTIGRGGELGEVGTGSSAGAGEAGSS